MNNRVIGCVLSVLLGISRLASGATLTVNGIAPPEQQSVDSGVTVSVVASGATTIRDWVALAQVGAANGSYIAWKYMNGSQTAPSSVITSATLSFTMASAAGNYEWRFFANNGFTRLATSGVVTKPSAALTVNGVAAPGTALTQPSGTATIGVTNGLGYGDWVGLYRVGSADSPSISWQYLSGTHTAPNPGPFSATLTFVMPVQSDLYEFRFFAGNGYTRLATSGPVSSQPPDCSTLVVSPGSLVMTPSGGTGHLNISDIPAACAWSASSNDSWFTVIDGANRTGPGTLNYSVQANATTGSRASSLNVAGDTVPVTQLAGPTTFFLDSAGTDSPTRYFGYYNPFPFTGTRPDRIDPATIDEQLSHVNILMLDADDSKTLPAAVMNKVTGAPLVGVVVFAPIVHDYASEDDGKIVTADYTAWLQAVSANSTTVGAVILYSEPVCGVPNATVLSCAQLNSNLVASSASLANDLRTATTSTAFPSGISIPQVLVVVAGSNYAQYLLENPSHAPGVQVLGFDCYRPWQSCLSGQNPRQVLDQFEQALPDKLFVSLMPGFVSLDPMSTDPFYLTEAQTLDNATRYLEMAQPDAKVRALMPFLRTYRAATGAYINAEGLSRAAVRDEPELNKEFTRVGQQFIGRSLVAPPDPVVLAEGSICPPQNGANICVHIEWAVDGRGSGIRAYKQGDPRSSSVQICTFGSPCTEQFLVAQGTYVLELVTIGADAGSTMLRQGTITVGMTEGTNVAMTAGTP